MMHSHWYCVKTYFKKVADNAFAERVNLKTQEIKRIAKGYRNINNFIIMISSVRLLIKEIQLIRNRGVLIFVFDFHK